MESIDIGVCVKSIQCLAIELNETTGSKGAICCRSIDIDGNHQLPVDDSYVGCGYSGKIKAGTVWGNCHAMIDTALPFGGYKESGIGREQGRQGLEASLETKTVIIQM